MSEQEPGIEALKAELEAVRREYQDFLYFMPALLEADVTTANITYMNRMARILLGFDEEDIAAGLNGLGLLDEDGVKMVLSVRDRHLATSADAGQPYEHTPTQDFYEANLRRKDGTWFAAEAQGSYTLDADGFPARIRFLFRDVTRRKEAEEALARSEERLRTLAANAPVILLQIDREGTVALIEGKGLQSLGLQPGQLVGWSAASVALGETPFGEIYRAAQGGGAVARRIEFGGMVLDIRAEPLRAGDGEPAGFVVVATDVTELDTAGRALVQSQKMESLGVLAGGIAHDFNNVLSTILGVTSVLKRSATISDEDREHVRTLEFAARRGAEVAGRVLAFARGGMSALAPADLREIVTDVANLAAPSMKRGIAIHTDFPADTVMVECDRGQLIQALLNIVLNARDAMPGGGEVRMTARSLDSQAVVTVSDSGHGMDEATRARIFEPFFTTKPPGEGTGLGLAVAQGIIASHNGTIAVRSAPGAGATFVIALPLKKGGNQPAEYAAVPPPPDRAVLVVDDDDLVRRALGSMLRHLGFATAEAASGGEAVALAGDAPGAFAAVILDLMMPGVTAADTLKAIHAADPSLPVIVCTGQPLDEGVLASLQGAAAILQKPFTAEELAAVLESRRVGAADRV